MKNKKKVISLFLLSLTSFTLFSCNEGNESEIISEKSTVNVTWESSNLYTIVGDNFVQVGANYTFNVIKLDEAHYDYSNMIVKVNDNIITSSSTQYVVNNVQEDLSIAIEGITQLQFRVAFQQETGFNFIGESYALAGEEYTFDIEITSSLIKPDSVIVLCNKAVVVKDNGLYRIKDVKRNLSISIYSYEFNEDPDINSGINQGDNLVEDF